MPMVARMLQELTGQQPDRSQSPDESVAHGAALYAGMLTARDAAAEEPTCELVNVNSPSFTTRLRKSRLPPPRVPDSPLMGGGVVSLSVVSWRVSRATTSDTHAGSVVIEPA